MGCGYRIAFSQTSVADIGSKLCHTPSDHAARQTRSTPTSNATVAIIISAMGHNSERSMVCSV
jgi:hypothetical protein